MVERLEQPVAVTGQSEVAAAFNQIGQAGSDAFARIAQAASQTNIEGAIRNIEAAAKRQGVAFGEMEQRVHGASESISKHALEQQKLGQHVSATNVHLQRIGESVKTAASSFLNLGNSINHAVGHTEHMIAGLQKLAVLVVGFEAVHKIFEAFEKAGEASKQLNDLAQSVGLTAKEFKAFELVGEKFGADATQMRQAIAKLEQAFKQMADGTAPAKVQKSFNDLGIVLSGSTKDKILQVGDALGKIEDPAKRTAIAMDLLGSRVGARLAAALASGTKGLQDINKEFAHSLEGIDKVTAANTKMQIAIEETNSRLGSLKNAIIAAVAPNVTHALEAFGESVEHSWDRIIAAAKPLTDAIKRVADDFAHWASDPHNIEQFVDRLSRTVDFLGRAFGVVGSVIKTAFSGLAAILDPIAKGITLIFKGLDAAGISAALFGQNLGKIDGKELAAVVITVGLLGGAFKAVGAAIAAAWALAMKNPWVAIATAVAALVVVVIENWDTIKEKTSEVWDFIKKKWQEALDWFGSTWVGSMLRWIGQVIDKFKEMTAAKSKATEGIAGNPDSGLGLERGGPVRGASGRDKIPAMLTNREYVHRVAAVDYYGETVMRAINNMSIPREQIAHFFNGGLVGALPMPVPMGYAGGGSVKQPMRTLHLTVGNETYKNLLAPEREAQRIEKVAKRKDINSGGRKPTSYRG